MATGTRICKICDKEYPYCKTDRPTGLYRWQDVACCPEHAAEYFDRIAVSRGEKAEDLDKADEPIIEEEDDLDDEEGEDEED